MWKPANLATLSYRLQLDVCCVLINDPVCRYYLFRITFESWTNLDCVLEVLLQFIVCNVALLKPATDVLFIHHYKSGNFAHIPYTSSSSLLPSVSLARTLVVCTASSVVHVHTTKHTGCFLFSVCSCRLSGGWSGMYYCRQRRTYIYLPQWSWGCHAWMMDVQWQHYGRRRKENSSKITPSDFIWFNWFYFHPGKSDGYVCVLQVITYN